MAPIVTGDLDPAALEDLVRPCVELDRLRRDGETRPDTGPAWEALEQAVTGKAVDLLSGPGGLASFLRRRQLGVRLGGPSLPPDIGYSETIPAGIRNVVMLRDRHCQATPHRPHWSQKLTENGIYQVVARRYRFVVHIRLW